MSRNPIVDFMIVGAQKSGTTTLHKMLCEHPSLVSCKQKEPAFFSKSPNWRAELCDYEALFPKGSGKMLFEASTTYTFFPHYNLGIWNDIYEYNPKMKIIYIVREPISRIVSSYMHHYERGFTDLSFDEALFGYSRLLDITRYTTQITPYIERFGRQNVKIGFFDDLKRDPVRFVCDIGAFLGVDIEPFRHLRNVHANESVGGHKKHRRFDHPGHFQRVVRRFAPRVWQRWTENSARAFHSRPVLTSAQAEAVLRILRPEIQGIEALTGRDLSAWYAQSVGTVSGRSGKAITRQ